MAPLVFVLMAILVFPSPIDAQQPGGG